MTRLQVRAGDQSVIVDGDHLIVSLTGLFKLETIDDLTILEVPAAAAATEQLEDLRDMVRRAEGRLGQELEKTGRLEAIVLDLRAELDEVQMDEGQNFWNGNIESDHPEKGFPHYRVSLFHTPRGDRGICQCLDFHFQGLTRGDPRYKCKHIVTAIQRSKRSRAA